MSLATNRNLTGARIGDVIVGQLVRRSPALTWSVECQKCLSAWNETHQVLMQHIEGGSLLRCKNTACARGALSAMEQDRERETAIRKGEREFEIKRRIESLQSEITKLSMELANGQ